MDLWRWYQGMGGEGRESVGRRRETRPNESGAKRQCLLEAAAEAEAHFGEGQCVCWCVHYHWLTPKRERKRSKRTTDKSKRAQGDGVKGYMLSRKNWQAKVN